MRVDADLARGSPGWAAKLSTQPNAPRWSAGFDLSRAQLREALRVDRRNPRRPADGTDTRCSLNKTFPAAPSACLRARRCSPLRVRELRGRRWRTRRLPPTLLPASSRPATSSWRQTELRRIDGGIVRRCTCCTPPMLAITGSRSITSNSFAPCSAAASIAPRSTPASTARRRITYSSANGGGTEAPLASTKRCPTRSSVEACVSHHR